MGASKDRAGSAARRIGVIGAVSAVLLSGCAGATGDGDAAGRGSETQPLRILAASGDGAVLYDPSDGTLTGHDRTGRVWLDRDATQSSVDVVCLTGCPEAAVSSIPSGTGPAAAPFRLSSSGRAPFPVSAAPMVHVLTARSTSDAVVEEGDATGRTWIRIVRPGADERTPVPHRGYQWAESADGSIGFAFPAQAEAPQGQLLRYVREGDGWRSAGAGPGDSLTGRCLYAALVARGECVAGARAAALVSRSLRQSASGAGSFHTLVRGLGPDGRTTWTREFAAEAGVTAHPRDQYVGVSDGRRFLLIDATGRTVQTREDVAAARFIPDGRLVVVSTTGAVGWLPSGDQ